MATHQNIPHYLNADVSYLPRPDVGTRRPVHVITSGDADRLAEMLKSMEEQDYVILGVELFAYCSACQGAGVLPDKRRKRVLYATIPCKACKGHRDALFTLPYTHANHAVHPVTEAK